MIINVKTAQKIADNANLKKHEDTQEIVRRKCELISLAIKEAAEKGLYLITYCCFLDGELDSNRKRNIHVSLIQSEFQNLGYIVSHICNATLTISWGYYD